MKTNTNTYSLADYTVTFEIPAIGSLPAETLSIGGPGDNGEGSFLGGISVSRANNLFDTESDPTGSWVHNKSLAKNGTVTLNLRQVSNNVIKLMLVCNAFESVQGRSEGIHITISPANPDGTKSTLVDCISCFIQKIPDQIFAAAAAEQPWVFTCGQIKFTPTL